MAPVVVNEIRFVMRSVNFSTVIKSEELPWSTHRAETILGAIQTLHGNGGFYADRWQFALPRAAVYCYRFEAFR